MSLQFHDENSLPEPATNKEANSTDEALTPSSSSGDSISEPPNANAQCDPLSAFNSMLVQSAKQHEAVRRNPRRSCTSADRDEASGSQPPKTLAGLLVTATASNDPAPVGNSPAHTADEASWEATIVTASKVIYNSKRYNGAQLVFLSKGQNRADYDCSGCKNLSKKYRQTDSAEYDFVGMRIPSAFVKNGRFTSRDPDTCGVALLYASGDVVFEHICQNDAIKQQILAHYKGRRSAHAAGVADQSTSEDPTATAQVVEGDWLKMEEVSMEATDAPEQVVEEPVIGSEEVPAMGPQDEQHTAKRKMQQEVEHDMPQPKLGRRNFSIAKNGAAISVDVMDTSALSTAQKSLLLKFLEAANSEDPNSSSFVLEANDPPSNGWRVSIADIHSLTKSDADMILMIMATEVE